MTAKERKIAKLTRILGELRAEATNPKLDRNARMGLAKATDALRWAIQDMMEQT